MSEWRPIDTAPKDGSLVRISGDNRHRAVWVYVKWNAEGGYWTDGDDMWTVEETQGWFWNTPDDQPPRPAPALLV